MELSMGKLIMPLGRVDKLIMSVDRSTKSESMNAANRALFTDWLKMRKFSYILAKSVYRGDVEQSFIIETDGEMNDIFQMAELFQQESVLEITTYYQMGFIHYMNQVASPKDPKYIGDVRVVSYFEVSKLDSYTQLNDKDYMIFI